MSDGKFDSSGFDLDALAAEDTTNDGSVVFEVGGSATCENGGDNATTQQTQLDESDSWKQEGNKQFKSGSFDQAFAAYTKAIKLCPVSVKPGGIQQEKPLAVSDGKQSTTQNPDSDDKTDTDDNNTLQIIPSDASAVQRKALAVYYCNRAAASFHMHQHEHVVRDSSIAIKLDQSYVKAFLRRSTAYEKLGKADNALKDAESASSLDPLNPEILRRVQHLKKLEDERLDALKEETMGKLKELGNNLLGNFGLSLNNFEAVEDPNTGSYSIKFNQNT